MAGVVYLIKFCLRQQCIVFEGKTGKLKEELLRCCHSSSLMLVSTGDLNILAKIWDYTNSVSNKCLINAYSDDDIS